MGPDGTGGQSAVRPRPGNLRTKVIAKESGHYSVRQSGVGDDEELQGTAWENLWLQFSNLMY